MSKVDILETELVWLGKYDRKGKRKGIDRIELPFQIVETINESRATKEARKHGKQLTLYDMWSKKEGDTFEEGWKNKLIWGENKLVMSSLVKEFAGKINLIYIDPPFATGADFRFASQIGEKQLEFVKEQTVVEEKAYRDTWGKGLSSYLQMIYERVSLMKDLLAENGSIYVHMDWHVGHYVKIIMDEIFGKENFMNEVIWFYRTGGASQDKFARKHDVLYFYTKGENYTFNPQKEKSYMMHKYGFKKSDFQEDERGQYSWVLLRDVWDLPSVGSHTSERMGLPTQKPEVLLERIIKASSNEGDLVADFFCGSGTTLAVAEKFKRRWIGCDLSRWAINITRKRLLGIQDCKPFELLNLGKYERKYWQTVTFGKKQKRDEHLTIFEYLKFILKLYGAEPLSGMKHLHGRKGSAVIHIGAVDAPVTIDEINACLEECRAVNQRELHILGWEWEMGLYDLITEAARGRGIKLMLFTIPREVMEKKVAERGVIQFYGLAYLEADIIEQKNRKVVAKIKDFVIPNYEMLPKEMRRKAVKWSDYIDYWAVDWNFQNDTFMNGWVTYRTRSDRKLLLRSDPHRYKNPGKYTIMIKVVDIFGNDTSQAFDVEVK